jgi:hypothetical protein
LSAFRLLLLLLLLHYADAPRTLQERKKNSCTILPMPPLLPPMRPAAAAG